MKPEDKLIEEINSLLHKWHKKFKTKSIEQPGSGIDNKGERDFFRAGYATAYTYAFDEITELIKSWAKNKVILDRNNPFQGEQAKALAEKRTCNIYDCKKEAVILFNSNTRPFEDLPYCEEHKDYWEKLEREGRGKITKLKNLTQGGDG